MEIIIPDIEKNKIKKEIEKSLKELNFKQITFFAWLCGMRALPNFRGKR
jgi:uncharacterized protein YjaG (DUF416 family)